jgi:circadian clock protein KaiB
MSSGNKHLSATEGRLTTVAKKRPAGQGRRAVPLDSAEEFEKLLKAADGSEPYQLRLYVTGTSLRSSQAIANIRSLCDEYLAGRYSLEVVDIYQQPMEAVDRQIIAAPTLVKELPMPLKRMVGDLSDRDKVLIGLNLAKSSKETTWVRV